MSDPSDSDARDSILANLALIHDRIRAACRRTGREENEVRLLLATKTVPAERIRLAVEAGELLSGENKVQELVQKSDGLAGLPGERHFIGHLQTNKIRDVIALASCIQSVDRLDLVRKLDQRLQRDGRGFDILVQVNTSQEASKFGLDPVAVPDFLRELAAFDTLRVRGLMTIGLFDSDPERVRPCLRMLREIRDRSIAEGLLPPDATTLSMGMSGDLETAIEEGSTMVRVGTAVFGPRLYPDSYYWPESQGS